MQVFADAVMRRKGAAATAAAAAADEEAQPHSSPRTSAAARGRHHARGGGGGGGDSHAAAAAAKCATCGGAPGWQADVESRCRPGLAWAVAFIFVGWPVLRHSGLVPGVVFRVAGAVGLAALARRLLTFRRWADEHRHVRRFIIAFAIMIAELLFENCMVWIVSVTDQRKYEDVPALQDNAEIALAAVAARSPLARWALYGDWVHTKEFLAAALAVAFSAAYDQMPYSGFGVMARFSATIALGRLLRVACFMTTVLPNPRPGCYRRRFPPPPDSAWEALRVGFTTLRGMGGCNDLVFSGHGAFWTLAPLLLGSYYPGRRWVLALVWLALAQSSCRDFLEHMHYSVDMLLAVVVTAAAWGWVRRVYPETEPLQKRPEGAPPDARNAFVLGVVAFGLTTAAVVILVAKA